jgi:carboxylesterase type B
MVIYVKKKKNIQTENEECLFFNIFVPSIDLS